MKQMPELKVEHLKLRRAYHNLFVQPDAEAVMADLYQRFNGTTLKHKDGIIDVHASIAAAGPREVLLYIEFMMRDTNATT